jgi:hypothetical protein
MALLDLPNELLIQIISHLSHERDINSVTLSNRRFYSLFNTYLYTSNIQHNHGRALLWASEHGRESTLRLLLDLGADINVKTIDYRYHFQNSQWNNPINGLYLACLKGHPNIARALLEAGINDSEHARKREAMPLYYALQQGHDDVALVLLEHFSDISLQLSWTNSRSTPLHLASNLGLSALVHLLLEKGADVQVEDAAGMTALHYALLWSPAACKECFEGAFFGMRKDITFGSKGEGYGKDIEAVKLLLEHGADMDRKREHGNWRHRHSARQLARHHPDEEMRRLFDVDSGWLGRTLKWK